MFDRAITSSCDACGCFLPGPVSSPEVGLAAAVAGASAPVLPTVGGGGIDTCIKAGAARERLTGDIQRRAKSKGHKSTAC